MTLWQRRSTISFSFTPTSTLKSGLVTPNQRRAGRCEHSNPGSPGIIEHSSQSEHEFRVCRAYRWRCNQSLPCYKRDQGTFCLWIKFDCVENKENYFGGASVHSYELLVSHGLIPQPLLFSSPNFCLLLQLPSSPSFSGLNPQLPSQMLAQALHCNTSAASTRSSQPILISMPQSFRHIALILCRRSKVQSQCCCRLHAPLACSIKTSLSPSRKAQ
jgi:hypothetical protein